MVTYNQALQWVMVTVAGCLTKAICFRRRQKIAKAGSRVLENVSSLPDDKLAFNDFYTRNVKRMIARQNINFKFEQDITM